VSEDKNEPASNTPPPLVPPPVRSTYIAPSGAGADYTGADYTGSGTPAGDYRADEPDDATREEADQIVSDRAVDDRDARGTSRADGDTAGDAPADDASTTNGYATGSTPNGYATGSTTNGHAADSTDESAAHTRDTDTNDSDYRADSDYPADSDYRADDAQFRDGDTTDLSQAGVAGREQSDTPRYAPEPTRPLATESVASAPAAAPQPERIFVPAPPVAPKSKSNRGVGSLIAAVSVVIFAIVYGIVAAVIIAIGAPGQPIFETLLRFLTDPVFYVPAILFVVGFVLVVMLVNRAAWWAFVAGSLLVGAIVYFGSIGVQLLTENPVGMTASEAGGRFIDLATNPFVIAAGLVARETSMWIGAAISSRGRRMKARNVIAKEEHERALAAHRAEYDGAHSSVS